MSCAHRSVIKRHTLMNSQRWDVAEKDKFNKTKILFASLELGGQESRSVELALRPGDLNSS